MLVSTSTSSKTRFGFEENLKMLKEAGFTAFDLTLCGGKDAVTLPAPFDGKDYIEKAKECRKFIDELGLPCNQAHAVFASYLGAAKKGTPLFEATIRCMEVAAIMGAKSIVVHPEQYLPYMQNAELLKNENIRFYTDLLPYAEKFGIIMLTENMWQRNQNNNHIIQSTCSEAKEFAEYVDMINSPYLKACLDIGHTCLTGESVANMIKTLGKDRLFGLHIHDVDAINDSHTLPYTEKVNFAEMIDALAEIGYTGDITFEAEDFFRPFPDELVPSAARLMADVGHYFAKSVQQKMAVEK